MIVLLGDEEVAVVELVTGFVATVAAEVVDAGFD